jgi:hypothetical protein
MCHCLDRFSKTDLLAPIVPRNSKLSISALVHLNDEFPSTSYANTSHNRHSEYDDYSFTSPSDQHQEIPTASLGSASSLNVWLPPPPPNLNANLLAQDDRAPLGTAKNFQYHSNQSVHRDRICLQDILKF